jgi:hypothetical protein
VEALWITLLVGVSLSRSLCSIDQLNLVFDPDSLLKHRSQRPERENTGGRIKG